MGTLKIDSRPPGATVLLGTRLAGTTPLEIETAPGTYDVTLRKEGAADLRFPVQVQAGRRTLETRELVMASTPPSGAVASAPASASLVVVTQPTGVAVYVDDAPLGTTDPRSGRLVKGGLEPGRHRVRLSRPGFDEIAEDVDVAEGVVVTFERTLPAPRAGSPTTLGAVALIAAVGTGLGLVLRRRRRSAASPVAVSPTPASVPRDATTTSRRTVMPGPTLSKDLETIATPTGRSGAGTQMTAAQSQFGEYHLLEPLGKGGMAVVFRAERRGQVCALKRPLTAFLEDPEFLERFLREAEIGRTLHHHNIIRIFERGEVDGVPYFTMELVEGETLQAHARRAGALEAREAAGIVAQVAEALDYAHLKGVIHRDLKPSNIMVLGDGTVKVMDYGIARARRFEGLTVTGAFLGTPDYVAPETAEGQGTDARSDLYSLGIVFYEILAGRRPFSADTPFATLRKHCTEPPPPLSSVKPGVPAELETIVMRLLSKKPEDRYPGAEELLIALRDFLNRAA
jgi:predicted Ser/Thr protein kinase